MESDTLELESRHFSKMMGEGSDDDMDELLDKMSKNQTNDSEIIEKSITFNSNLSENMIKLVRTIENRIDRDRSAEEGNQDELLLVHQTKKSPTGCYNFDGDPSVINVYPSVFDGDPSVIHENRTVQFINDIEQGLNHLYAKGEKTIVPEEIYNKISVKNRLGVKIEDPIKTYMCRECGKSFSTIKQLQQHLNEHSLRKKGNLINIEERVAPLKPKDIIQSDFFDIQIAKDIPEIFSSQVKSEKKPSSERNHIKSRLGDKVEEISSETYPCIKCKEHFPTVGQLQQHISNHLQELKKMERKIEEKLSRKSRNASPVSNGYIKNTRSIKESDKKVICRHCKSRFFKLDDLLCHLRAEHRARKRSFNKFIDTVECKSKAKDSSPWAKVTKKIGLSNEKYNDTSNKIVTTKFAKSVEIKSNRKEIRTDSSESDRLQFICDVCAGIFFTKYDLVQHKDRTHCRNKTGIVHDSRMKFVCKFCPVTFSKFYDLKKHLRVAHGNYISWKGATANTLSRSNPKN